MSMWRGVPLEKAILVRHMPRTHDSAFGRKGKGAISVSSAESGLEYIAREGRFEDRSDIERGVTAHDIETARIFGDLNGPVEHLRYISREEGWEWKGQGRQEDPSLWDRFGPRSLESVREQMARDGGAYIDSFVSVSREHAERLGLSSKEDMQRLVRATWSENVEHWGLVRDPSDIRWVAAYHSDADHSLHCHIFTWSARGEIEPGATVGREQTRAGKEAVLRLGYERIREERDERSNWLRDISRQAVLRQMGMPVDERRLEQLHEKGARLGYPERVPDGPDWPASRAGRYEELANRLRGDLLVGRGRLSGNWRLSSAARDMVHSLERDSPSVAAIMQARERCTEARCDIRGYTEGAFPLTRRDMLRDDREDMVGRMSTALVRAYAAESGASERYRSMEGPGAARGAHEREEAREMSRQRRRRDQERMAEAAVREPGVLERHSMLANRYGTSVDNIRQLGLRGADLQRSVARDGATGLAGASEATRALAMDYGRRVVSMPRAQRMIDLAAARALESDPTLNRSELRGELESRAVERAADAAIGNARHLAPAQERAGTASPGRGDAGMPSGLHSIFSAIMREANDDGRNYPAQKRAERERGRGLSRSR